MRAPICQHAEPPADLLWWLIAGASVAAAAVIGLAYVAWRTRRAIVDLRCDVFKETAGIHRSQRRLREQIAERGWGDSLELTAFDWRKPGPF